MGGGRRGWANKGGWQEKGVGGRRMGGGEEKGGGGGLYLAGLLAAKAGPSSPSSTREACSCWRLCALTLLVREWVTCSSWLGVRRVLMGGRPCFLRSCRRRTARLRSRCSSTSRGSCCSDTPAYAAGRG